MFKIEDRHEAKRGCGYRKQGGTYLVSDAPCVPCGKLPIILDVCPTCHGGIKPSRGWTWVNGTALAAQNECRFSECSRCPLGGPIGRCGLLWIGEKFYPTPLHWTKEATEMGVSRKIAGVPRDFKLSEHFVLIAHRKCIQNADDTWTAGVFHAFKPARIEYVVRGDEEDKELERRVKAGQTLVRVHRKEELVTEAQSW